jgi:hypothetical protein
MGNVDDSTWPRRKWKNGSTKTVFLLLMAATTTCQQFVRSQRTDSGWLRAWSVMKSNADMAVSPPHHRLHILFQKLARQRKQVCQQCLTINERLLRVKLSDRNRSNEPTISLTRTLAAPPPVPRFPARRRLVIEAFCFSRRHSEQPRSRPVCQLNQRRTISCENLRRRQVVLEAF